MKVRIQPPFGGDLDKTEQELMMTEMIHGGCFCGDIRYVITEPAKLQLFCFCADCRQRSGTDGYAGYMVSNETFAVSQGEPSVFRKTSSSGRTVEQNFCGRCGTNLWGQTELGMVSVSAGTLDDPELFQPTKKVFLDQAPSWARVPGELEEM